VNNEEYNRADLYCSFSFYYSERCLCRFSWTVCASSLQIPGGVPCRFCNWPFLISRLFFTICVVLLHEEFSILELERWTRSLEATILNISIVAPLSDQPGLFLYSRFLLPLFSLRFALHQSIYWAQINLFWSVDRYHTLLLPFLIHGCFRLKYSFVSLSIHQLFGPSVISVFTTWFQFTEIYLCL
jgi:hypothetical protein